MLRRTRRSPSLQPCRSHKRQCECAPAFVCVAVGTGVTFFSLFFDLFCFVLCRYVAQLYHRISKIEWDYECEMGMIKGSILSGERGPCALVAGM